jgi:YidC/Oxa1 family membrane protein insertase
MLSAFWTQVFIRPLYNLLVFLHNVIPGHDLGVAIIILTIIIRFILYPSSKKAIETQRAQLEYQPELDKIKEKYKDDKEKQTQETMAFYKKHKINPFSSCLPLLIQMPILIALYWVFRSSLSVDSFQLLYPFVHQPASLNTQFLGLVNLIRPEVYVFPILAGATQFLQSWMLLKRKKAEKKEEKKDMMSVMSKQMTYIFPIITVLFAASLPAAISLYWITTNLFSIVQQYIIMRSDGTKPKVIVRKK